MRKHRLNVDETPLSFVGNSKKTGEFVEKGYKYHNMDCTAREQVNVSTRSKSTKVRHYFPWKSESNNKR